MFLQSASIVRVIILFAVALICTSNFAHGDVSLPPDEEQALREVGESLGVHRVSDTMWNLYAPSPCYKGYANDRWPYPHYSGVVCNCSYANDTVCHVISIDMARDSLLGVLPWELVKLPFLQIFDVSGNHLHGTIPPEWGTMSNIVNLSIAINNVSGPIPKELGNLSTLRIFDLSANRLTGPLPKELGNLSTLEGLGVNYNYLNGIIPKELGNLSNLKLFDLSANRLTGPLPKELGNLSTLEGLDVSMNRLSGHLPPELGNLSRIKILGLRSNNFTGELPSSFAKLIALTNLKLGDNNFIGQIPYFIQNLINLKTLEIQGSGLQGPIPDSFELLKNLTDLRISDLNGPERQFPQFNSPFLTTLILRSCNLSGDLPESLPWSNLTKVDFSFNRLTGVVPSIYLDSGLVSNSDSYLFLSGNQLSGTTSDWNVGGSGSIDISYNNFTFEPSSSGCQKGQLNMFASSSRGNTSGIVSCLSNRCSNSYYNLYINCGGNEVTIGGIKYDQDIDAGAPSHFFSANSYHWGYSSTGYFMDYSDKKYIKISNAFKPSIDNPLLWNARASPLSLTYYAFCLMNGNYTLSLHFAEIEFTDDETYGSLGRRFFDVYIQGKVVYKDFDIAAEAGGVGKEIVKNFTVVVTDSTLEIRLYWAGKGTTMIPFHYWGDTGIPSVGTYGPLISAISLNPNFIPTEEQSGNKISTGATVGIVILAVCSVFVILGTLWWRGCFGHKETAEQDLKGLDLKTGSFTLKQMKAATNNFHPANKIGEGGFGSVYKGFLLDGTIIAVKQLSSKSKQGNREFVNEIGMISALQHPHLVKLYGCCTEGNQLLLVYEYMENNNLARALFGPVKHQLKLDWTTRYMICIGMARGLAYLHGESRLKIVHRDIKSTNVLLDKHLSPKISDFGLAKLDEEDNTHISTRIAGTLGYMAPEYAMRGYLTDKADVYSFGIVVLEIICGKSNTSYEQKDKCFYLLDWANVLKEKGDLIELVDPRLGFEFNKEEAMMIINVALLCTNVSPVVRPTMSSVVSMLEGKIKAEALPPHAAITIDEASFAAMRKHFRGTLEAKVSKRVTQSFSMEGLEATSSTSANDLYSISLDSDYLLGRD